MCKEFKNRIVPWKDPITKEDLIQENEYLVSTSGRYLIQEGIPNFVPSKLELNQSQVKETFGYKWTISDLGQDDSKFNSDLKNFVLDLFCITEDDLSIFNNKIILDVGVGSGSSARLWASRAKEFHGIDISKAVYRAKKSLQSSTNPILSQADLNLLPYADGVFDVIVSYGVLHHTPNTKSALQSILKKLKPSGLCLFYIYKKKSPLREFSDDFIRTKISDLPYEDALSKLDSVTRFAKELHEQNITFQISNDIPLLGIKKGEYDLQLFIYQYFFKCFWNDKLGFADSNIINFDWYYPKYAWRHTEKEIREWCDEFNLEIKFLKENDSGFSCLVSKN